MKRLAQARSLVLLLTLYVCLGSPIVYAQNNAGTSQGSVADASGATVAGPAVTGKNLDTGLTLSSLTTDSGLYSLANVPAGRYSVSVEKPGLKKYTREGVSVQTSSTTSLDIQLVLGAVSETVTVNADASQLQTATSDIGATVQNTLVQNLPLEVSGTIR